MTKRDVQTRMTRRGFLKTSGAAAIAGGALAGCGTCPVPAPAEAPASGEQAKSAPPDEPTLVSKGIKRYRTLGRTGFQVSDISMGCGEISEANVVRYACDLGINFFDVAEGYGNGDSERKIGEAMPNLDRKKIFIVTKTKTNPEDTEQMILDRFAKCQERLKTDYVDAFYMHSVTRVESVKHEGFHSAIAKLKAEGRVKFAGLSCHGPHGKDDANMDQVLLAAAEDGRFDVMLIAYNFLKTEEGDRVLAACREKNIGTSCMKAYPGKIEFKPFDKNNLTDEDEKDIARLMEREMTREQAIERIETWSKRAEEEMVNNKPAVDAFIAEHGVRTQDELDEASIRWVLKNADMHTICVSMPNFDKLDQIVPLSGTELTASNERLLGDYAAAFGSRYCRHGCKDCLALCPHGVPVSTVMRYSYYFSRQGREKHAIAKYAALSGADGSRCLDCDAPCLKGCPHGFQIQAGLLRAHRMLSLA